MNLTLILSKRSVLIGLAAVLIAALVVSVRFLTFQPGDATVDGSTSKLSGRRPETILRVAVPSLPPGLGNPFTSISIPTIYTWAAIFDSLTYVTEDGEILPWLATSWEGLDENTWSFQLQPDVMFHNGVPLTAQSVADVVAYIVSDEAKATSVGQEMYFLESAEAIDHLHVVIKTKQPQPMLLSYLAMLPIVEMGAWRGLGEEGFAMAPVGTGPYRLKEWSNSMAKLSAFESSWRAPKTASLELVSIVELSARVQALLSGSVDIALSINVEDIPAIKALGGKTMLGKTLSNVGVTFILTKLPPDHPLMDKRVRQALNYAVNKERYIEALLAGRSRVASQPATPETFGYNEELEAYSYDPERARTLLADAGFADGFEFTAILTPDANMGLSAVYQQVAADLRSVGVTMKIIAIPITRLIQNVHTGNWTSEAFGMNYNAERSLDALRFTRLHSCRLPNPWYCNVLLTEEIERASIIWDLEERRRRVQGIMAHYHEDAPAIWLHQMHYLHGVSGTVSGFQQDLAFVRYDSIELEK